MPIIRRAVSADCEKLAPNLRQPDLDEAQAARGVSGLQALRDGIALSEECFSVTDGGQVLGMFGFLSLPAMPGAIGVWAMNSQKLLEDHQRRFLRESRKIARKLGEKYTLFTVIDVRNTDNIRWLEWLGFEAGAPIPGIGRGITTFIQMNRPKNV